MCITEYDEEKVMNQFREEGKEEKTKEFVINMLKDHFPVKTIARLAIVSEENVRRIAQSEGIAIA